MLLDLRNINANEENRILIDPLALFSEPINVFDLGDYDPILFFKII